MPPDDQSRCSPIAHLGDPGAVVARWPNDRPLVALVSAPTTRTRWARWSILATPTDVLRADTLDAPPLHPAQPRAVPDDRVPFQGGWIGALEYELGRVIEPAARHGDARSNAPHTLVRWFRCPGAYVHDAHHDRWWAVGTPDARAALPAIPARDHIPDHAPWRLGPFQSDIGRNRYEHDVARVIDLIRDGDIFQANLTHRLHAPFHGSARAWFRTLLAQAGPWYGAYLEDEQHAVLSASPELFLELHAESGTVTTRPIKGTCPVADGADRLERSNKDQAELAMIVDLMRNDLGRVCRVGSMSVDVAREIERHGGGAGAPDDAGVYQGVATVSGRLRADAGLHELLRATFPGGSITGAPKIRAMQIIELLEPTARGLYTGSIGFVSDCGNATFNIAIRTAIVRGETPDGPGRFENAHATVGVGGGIVVDSDPASEWLETLHKGDALARSSGEHAETST